MFPILYDENSITYGVVPTHRGLGTLTDCLSCIVTEERNGIYELELTYPASGIHAKDFAIRHLLKVKPNFTDDEQLFRIYKIGKVLGSSFKVYAQHISYDLSGSSITSGSAESCVSACALLSNNDFVIDTDKNVTANFSITEPSSRKSWLGGKAGSLLDVYGTGEYHYDNFNIHFLLHRGTNRGVTVRYGKNLLSLSQEKDGSNLVTHVILFWKSQEDGTVVYSAKTSTGVSLDVENCICIDVSDQYDEQPTIAQLNTAATNYVQNHNFSVVKNNIKLDFLQMKTLKDRVDLCDEVHVYYEDYDIDATVKCIKTKWNVLKERYESIELGDVKNNFADTFLSNNEETKKVIDNNTSMLAKSIKNATELITGNAGGYVVLHDSNGDGEPDEILIMNTPDITTARKVWRWNASGLGYSSTGYNGTYGLAMTIDGEIVASFITTGTMSANRVRTGRLESTDGQNYFDLDAGSAHFENLSINIGGTSTSAATAISNAQSAADTAQQTADGKVSPTEVRTKFAADNTSITIQSGTITFNSNSFIVNSNNLNIDRYGSVKASSFYYNSTLHFQDTDWTNDYIIMTGARTVSGNIVPLISMNNADNHQTVAISASKGGSTNFDAIASIVLYGKNYSQGSGKSVSITDQQLNMRGTNNSMLLTLGSYTGTPSNPTEQGYIFLRNSSGTATIQEYGADGRIICVSLTQTSTRKVKKNIKDLEEAEAKKILDIRPVIYDFKDESLGTNKRGFIAEDVYDIIPEIVDKHEGEISGLSYTEIIPYCVKMIQLQQEQIEDLKRRIKA